MEKRIIELYNVGKEFNKIDEKYTNKELIGNIKINDLNYSYNGRNKVLNKVNLDINQIINKTATTKTITLMNNPNQLISYFLSYFSIFA